jgi:multisubunit Na+/H+ antiporter MnhC subunit
MANFIIGLSLLDSDGDTSSMQVYYSGADAAAALAFGQGLASAVDDLTLSQVTGMSITQDAALPGGLKAAPAANSDNEVKGRFLFRSAAGYPARISIPGFDKDNFTVVGGDIDTADPLVFAFAETAIVLGGATTSHFEDITALARAYEAFGKG